MAKDSIIRRLARLGALDSGNATRLISETDGGPGSGNFGHKGRPGQVGGSGKGEGGGETGGKSETSSGTSSPRGVERARSVLKNVLKSMNPGDDKNSKALKRDLEWVAEAPDNKEFLRRSRDVKDVWDKVIKSGPAEFPYKEYGDFLKAAGMSERMGNRGNYGHGGRGGGGSAPSGANGKVSGNAGKAPDGTVYRGRDYTLKGRGLESPKGAPGKVWQAIGGASEQLPNGSGATKISEDDVRIGLHTINKHLNPDGTLTPERAAFHEKIIQDMFAGKKKPGPGEQKVFYFLGGGSASGKGSFTRPGDADKYGMPDKTAVTVIDADELKGKLPEYDPKAPTGTNDRNKAASFAHEESSALAKRAMQAAFDNGYNCTLDGTGDNGVKGVMKKLKQARTAGYRVEGRYCTASIENALQRNRERAKKEGRLVQTDSVIAIHKNVSEIFEQIAPEFDHIELWDHDGPKPIKIFELKRGQNVKDGILDQKLYKKFLDKAKWEPPEIEG